MSLIFVDVEAFGGCPAVGRMTEFGAVRFDPYRNEQRWDTFHGSLISSTPNPDNPAVPLEVLVTDEQYLVKQTEIFSNFNTWLSLDKTKPVFVSDNPSYDFMWIADGFYLGLGHNPFGHSGRRISDFYAGLMGDFRQTQRWKRLRITKHTHHPVDDAKGNVEAFARILRGER